MNTYQKLLRLAGLAIAFLFPHISLYHVALFAPTVCFGLGLGVMCFFLYRAFGLLFASEV